MPENQEKQYQGENFADVIRSKKGCAVIMAGSDSDLKEHIPKIEKSLEKYGIPYDIRICSAHKQNDELGDIIESYNDIIELSPKGGLLAFIAVAGGSDALSGTASYHTFAPVISCPPDATPDKPNMSCLTNPPGSSNAYITRPANVGRFIAQMFAQMNPDYRRILSQEISDKRTSLMQADTTHRRYSKP